MNKTEFDAFTKAVDDKLGNLEMTWEGPEPHDFRPDSIARGVRFIHSYLFAKVPPDECTDITEAEFRILCGNTAAAEAIGARITAAGFAFVSEPWPMTDGGRCLSFSATIPA